MYMCVGTQAHAFLGLMLGRPLITIYIEYWTLSVGTNIVLWFIKNKKKVLVKEQDSEHFRAGEERGVCQREHRTWSLGF